jgi:hypothetical protein
MIVALPPFADAVAPPLLLTLTEPGSEELQVNGAVMVAPRVSSTVGVMVFEVLVEDVTVSTIDCTGQVVKYAGTLLVLPIVAKMEVRPGTLAVAWTCPGSKPLAVVLSVATFVN